MVSRAVGCGRELTREALDPRAQNRDPVATRERMARFRMKAAQPET